MNAETRLSVTAIVLGVAMSAAGAADRNVLVVLDASNSMWGQLEKQHKIAIAKSALFDLVDQLDEMSVHAGLVVYGHRNKGSCDDIELVVDLAPLNKKNFRDAVQRISPKGMTPIASAVELAAARWKGMSGDKQMILLTDGIETCERDPVEVVRKLKLNDHFRLHVVGLDVVKQEDSTSLRELARTGGGGYYTAASVEELHEALKSAAETIQSGEPPPLVEKVQENVGVILDRSTHMGKPYEGSTRLDLARVALVKILERQVADRDNLAFRHYGGACKGGNSELIVPFGLNNGPSIREAVQRVSIRGKRTLVDAVIAAATDIENQVPYEDVNKRVVIITGGMDACDRTQGVQYINKMLENRKVLPHYAFIGIGVTESDAAALQQLAGAVGGNAYFVRTQDKLDKLLEWLFEVQPVERQLNAMIQSLNQTINTINAVMTSLNEGNVISAQSRADEAGALTKGSFIAYRDLARRQGTDKYVSVFDTATLLRDMQKDLVQSTVTLISNRPGYDRYVSGIEVFDKIVGSYNTNVSKANELVRNLRE